MARRLWDSKLQASSHSKKNSKLQVTAKRDPVSKNKVDGSRGMTFKVDL